MKRGCPFIREEIDITTKTVDLQQKHDIIHSFRVDTDNDGNSISAQPQKVGAFAVFFKLLKYRNNLYKVNNIIFLLFLNHQLNQL